MLQIALALMLVGGATVWGVQSHVVGTAEPFVFLAHDVPEAGCILVPGARIHADGTPYGILIDRLAMALELYRAGKAPRIVVSGRGGGGLAVDEVAAMRRWLRENGVPDEAIRDDAHGYRTLDSMRNCRQVANASSVIVTSNDFHVPRMVFLGRHLEFECYGVAAPALRRYSWSTMLQNRGREVLARVRACIDVYW